jgi:hypothetical protein
MNSKRNIINPRLPARFRISSLTWSSKCSSSFFYLCPKICLLYNVHLTFYFFCCSAHHSRSIVPVSKSRICILVTKHHDIITHEIQSAAFEQFHTYVHRPDFTFLQTIFGKRINEEFDFVYGTITFLHYFTSKSFDRSL